MKKWHDDAEADADADDASGSNESESESPVENGSTTNGRVTSSI